MLAQSAPNLAPVDVDAAIALQLRLASSDVVNPDPIAGRVEHALESVWRTLSADTAAVYAASLGPLIRVLRDHERHSTAARPLEPGPEGVPSHFGAYVVDGVVGWGADGVAYRVHHQESALLAVVKLPAHGDGTVLDRLGQACPPGLLRIFDRIPAGNYDPGHPWAYDSVVREYADEVLSEVLERDGPPPASEALSIFTTCCETVAWLHEQQIYGWSAHPGNVFKVGGTWKIGDMGRCKAYVAADHPSLIEKRATFRLVMPQLAVLPDELADWLLSIDYGCHPQRSGFWPYDDYKEWRLRMDDCAMLGGLLCGLLSGRRWSHFYKAVNGFPYCSAQYALTGDRHTDRVLSGILNRCWRGDAGGALLVANDGRGEQTVYEDPCELLADVEAAVARS